MLLRRDNRGKPRRLKADNRGMSIIFAVFTLLLLSVVGTAIFSMISSDVDTGAGTVISSRAFWAAESGLQLGMRAVRDDVEATDGTQTGSTAYRNNGFCALLCLDGYTAGGSGAVFGNYEGACLRGDSGDCRLDDCDGAPGSYVEIEDFQQCRNLIGSRIISSVGAKILLRAMAVAEGPPPDPPPTFETVDLVYTTDNWTSQNVLDSFGVVTGVFMDYATPTLFSVTWDKFISGDVEIRAVLSDGDLDVRIDQLSLLVTVEIDDGHEPWYDDWMHKQQWPATGDEGTPRTKNIGLGDSQIITVMIQDESAKVHLNYASQQLLDNLLDECGVTDHASLAASIVARQPGFDTIEELMDPSGVNMSESDFNLVRDDVTVYSWVNNNAMDPGSTPTTASRAPVNLNFASEEVLRAIFRCGAPNITDTNLNNLMEALLTHRARGPFTHLDSFSRIDDVLLYLVKYQYTGMPPGLLDPRFSKFILDTAAGYLTADERYAILANADASVENLGIDLDWSDNIGGTHTWYPATEFSYYSNSFLIEAVGESGGVERTVRSVYGNRYNYSTYSFPDGDAGTLNMPVTTTDANPEAYWREIRNE